MQSRQPIILDNDLDEEREIGRAENGTASACEPSAASSPTGAGSSPAGRCRSAEGGNSARREARSPQPAEADVDLDDEDLAAQQPGELYEHFALTVDKGQSPLRIDKYLTCRLEKASRNRIQEAADSGNILVGGVAVKASYKVKPLDRISIVMPYPRREVEIIPENIPLDILYEDNALLVVNKPAGMVVHPGHGNYSGTLVNALTFHLQGQPLFEGSDMRAGLVHRIDKNTSGLLVVAKTAHAHTFLAKQFFDHTISRRYEALVWGNFEQDEGRIEGNIGRSVRDRLRMAVFPSGGVESAGGSGSSGGGGAGAGSGAGSGTGSGNAGRLGAPAGAGSAPGLGAPAGKHAITHYKVLRRFGYVSLVECRLETGRTHQIRVHMEYIGHPLFNDERYGGDRILKGTTFSKYRQFVENCFALMPRHALHARSLGFIHPTTREEVYFEVEPPEDFRALVAKWESYSAGRETETERRTKTK